MTTTSGPGPGAPLAWSATASEPTGELLIDDTATTSDGAHRPDAGPVEDGDRPVGVAARTVETDGSLGRRAARTRSAILEASRGLFLERGYAGTRISNITDACGISRAGFYTYFRDKREIFNVLGETAYREILELVGRVDQLPTPATRADIEGWVRAYFGYLDEHGAFILSAASGPDDEDVRAHSRRMQTRVVWLLGVALRARQAVPTEAPEALGLVVQAMLDRAWFLDRSQDLPVGDDDVVTTVAGVIAAALGAPAA